MDEPPRTLADLLAERVRESGEAIAYRYREFAGAARTVNYREFGERVQSFALGLTSLGLGRSSRICIIGGSGLEWTIADLGAIVAGGVTVGLDAGSDPTELTAIVERLGCELAVCGTRKSVEPLAHLAGGSSQLKRVVGWGRAASVPGVLPFGQVCLMGNELEARDSKLPAQLFAAPSPDDPALILLDPGADPFGAVVLSHRNCCFSVANLARVLGAGESDESVSHLPMHDPVERLFGTFLRLETGMATHILGDEPLIDALVATRPTVYLGTPATLQCLKDQWVQRVLETFPWKRRVLSRGQKVGTELARHRARQQALSPLLRAKGMLFDRLVLAGARECLGGRLRTVVTTFGPAPVDLLGFYEAFGLRTVEGWGTRECTGLCTLSPTDLPCPGSVGRPVPGVEVAVFSERRLRTRGPHVCLGHLDADGGTVSACDDDGWLTVHDDARMDTHGCTWLSQ